MAAKKRSKIAKINFSKTNKWVKLSAFLVFIGAFSVIVATIHFAQAAVIYNIGHVDYYFDGVGNRLFDGNSHGLAAFRIGIEARGINNSGTLSVQYLDAAASAQMYKPNIVQYVCLEDLALKNAKTDGNLSTNNGPHQCINSSTSYVLRGSDPNRKVASGNGCMYAAVWVDIKYYGQLERLSRMTNNTVCGYSFL